MVLDQVGQKGAVHVSLPASDLGLTRTELRQIGIDASSIQLDAVFDGDAIYAKSPLLASGIRSLLAGDAPAGDLTGWLRLATRGELSDLGSLGGGAIPSAAPLPTGSGSSRTNSKIGPGITLTLAGTEQTRSRQPPRHRCDRREEAARQPARAIRRRQQRRAARSRPGGHRPGEAVGRRLDRCRVEPHHRSRCDGRPNAPAVGFTMTLVFADPDGSSRSPRRQPCRPSDEAAHRERDEARRAGTARGVIRSA